jgi:hypothetical protein
VTNAQCDVIAITVTENAPGGVCQKMLAVTERRLIALLLVLTQQFMIAFLATPLLGIHTPLNRQHGIQARHALFASLKSCSEIRYKALVN